MADHVQYYNNDVEQRESLLEHIHDDNGDYGRDNSEAEGTTYEDAIKQTGYGKFHIFVLILCGWAVSSDAIEVLSVSFMLPSATCELSLSSSDKGWLNAVIFIGMLIGGYVWGSLADHYGRRAVLLGSLTVNGLGGLGSSCAQIFWLFLLLRFISGIGVGGSMPVIFSYFTEFQPKEKRGMMISVLATFWMCGNIIAAGLAWIIIPLNIGYKSPDFDYDSWRIFVAVCTIPSLTSAAIFVLMPESPKFLLTKGHGLEALAVMKKVYKTNNPDSREDFKVKKLILTRDKYEKRDGIDLLKIDTRNSWYKIKSSIKLLLHSTVELFQPPLKRGTIVMLIVNFSLSYGYYGLWMWFPELFSRVEKYGGSPCESMSAKNQTAGNSTSGVCSKPEDWVFFEGFMTALSNLPGNLLTIFLMDRVGRKPLLVLSMLASGVSVFFIPFIHDKIQNLLISCLFGAVSTVGWNAIDVLSAELFPTNVRSTAIGVISGINRVAAILGNITFGELVDVHCAIPMLMVAALLTFGGLCSIKLPNTTRKDIH
ncbi:hypothetical protein KUTeg_007967 [Tegillarca granosa]|uniref:Major facilitator superfamily (MFS) profile domain-containing protein n=1 Tax=Tegillarca granosa TaxID=220873 RepID=A0ABQ9FES0_TEGGR|nr:hypothetical protein KUTeg_007967 [Tegillarca granosa]